MCALALGGGAARAQLLQGPNIDNTVYGFMFGPSVGIEHDSNFYRTSGTETITLPGSTQPVTQSVPLIGDTFTDASLSGSFHQIYGRQTVSASASVGRVNFHQDPQFDYTQEDIRARLDSEFAYNFSSTVIASRSSQLLRFADLGSFARDVLVQDQLEADAFVPLSVDFRLLLSGIASRSTNSAGAYQTLNLDTDEADAGIRFRPASGNTVDAVFRSTLGRYPNGTPSAFLSPQYHDRAIEGRVDWTFAGTSHLAGRAGYMERRNDDLILPVLALGGTNQRDRRSVVDINRNFSGAEYDLNDTWQITGTSKLLATANRQVGATGNLGYLSATTHTYRIMPGYQPADQIEVDAYYEWAEVNYFSGYSLLTQSTNGVIRLDTNHNTGLVLNWVPRRWSKFMLDVHREERSSNISQWNYRNNVISLNAQASF